MKTSEGQKQLMRYTRPQAREELAKLSEELRDVKSPEVLEEGLKLLYQGFRKARDRMAEHETRARRKARKKAKNR